MQWLQKLFVVLVTILTFGMVVPAQHQTLEVNTSKSVDEQNVERLSTEDQTERESTSVDSDSLQLQQPIFSLRENVTYTALEQAQYYGEQKFGPKINRQIGSYYNQEIIPALKRSLDKELSHVPDGELEHIGFTVNAGDGYGEKIFHILNEKSGEDLFRFHVRREHPPQDGYYFVFHYHAAKDNFEEHYPLGKIYWGKNTPPKWTC